MKSRILGLTMLLVVGYVSNSYSFVQLNCTNYGCLTVNVMAHVYQTGFTGCTVFSQQTGRKLRNLQGVQGGDPIENGGTQNTLYTTTSCASCTPPTGNQNVIAIQSWGMPNPANWSVGSFGIFSCPGMPMPPNP
jgi:hypothetical protein